MRREVTQGDIDRAHQLHGEQGQGFNFDKDCPVALAIRRQAGRAEIRVGSLRAYHALKVVDSNTTIFPDEAQQFIRDFDDGQPVQPFSFEYDLNKIT